MQVDMVLSVINSSDDGGDDDDYNDFAMMTVRITAMILSYCYTRLLSW